MESYENIKNAVVRDSNDNIIQANGFNIGEYIVFDRKLGAYSDNIFRIDEYIEMSGRSYIKYEGGMQPIDDFFRRGGYRKATTDEINAPFICGGFIPRL